jgi:predicted small secreted protein
MKRFIYIAVTVAVLAFGATACKKAHDAGNDSMSAGHSSITSNSGTAASDAPSR